MSWNIGNENEYDVHWLIYPDVVRDSAEAVFILIGRKVGRYVYGSVLYPCIAQQKHTSCDFISRTSYKSPRVLAAPGLREGMSHGAGSRAPNAHPPFSQIPHGSLLSPAFAVKEPFVDSNAQKKSVLFGCPSRCTPMLPAKLRPNGHVTFGKGSVTSKSTDH